jgi:hypothetical protein
MHEYQLVTSERTRPIFLDREDLLPGDCIVIGSTVYKVNDVKNVDGKVQIAGEKVGDKLYVAMLSEW